MSVGFGSLPVRGQETEVSLVFILSIKCGMALLSDSSPNLSYSVAGTSLFFAGDMSPPHAPHHPMNARSRIELSYHHGVPSPPPPPFVGFLFQVVAISMLLYRALQVSVPPFDCRAPPPSLDHSITSRPLPGCW